MKKQIFNRISPEEAFRALYVDFEGFRKEPPSLVGVACEYELEQVVLSEGFRGAANAKKLRIRTIEQAGEELLERSRGEDRLVVGYSQIERQLFKKYGGVELGRRYRDGRMIGRRWINKIHKGAVEEWGLTDLLAFMGYRAPTHLGKGLVTKRLRGVRRGLQVHNGNYNDLTPVQKAKWTKLLDYNRIDCLALRDLVLRAASEIALSNRRTSWKAPKFENERSGEEAKSMPSDKKQTNIRLSDEGRELLEKIADMYALPFSSVMELAVRKYAEELRIWSPEQSVE